MFKKISIRRAEKKMKLPKGTIINFLQGDETELRGYVKDGKVIWK